MLNNLIKSCLKRPGLVIAAIVLLLITGINEYLQMPVDAFPDISPIMVPIFCESHGMAPEEMERLVTWPIESSMNGLPNVTEVKSTSAFGLAVIYVYFTDSTDIFFARQLVSERLASSIGDLPTLETPPTLGPISSGLGQIFIYYLSANPKEVETDGKELNTWLRELNDWLIKYQLQTVRGVTAVLSMGGHVLQYQIRLDPQLLNKYQLSLEQVTKAVTDNNANAGGQFIVSGAEEYLVRGIGLVQSLEGLRTIPVKVEHGNPVLLGDIAEIGFGNEVRRGVVTRNGETEVVSGIVMKLYGENTSAVIQRLHQKLAQLKTALPKGVKLVASYDQAELVNNATGTVINSLLQGSLLIIIILLLFLGSMRTALIVMLSLPICALTAVIIMNHAGVSANLMSLGGIAIAIGMLCDGSIVVMESILAQMKRRHNTDESSYSIVLRATGEVSKPVLFAGIIVIIVFLPLLTLQGVEGKMFSPMAFSISSAMLGSILVALLIVPSLALIFIHREDSDETSLVKWLQQFYQPLLTKAMSHAKLVVMLAFISLGLAGAALSMIGTEFVPVLEEGSIFIGVSMAPSISLEKATELVMHLEKQIMQHSEVKEVISRVGRPEAGSHPHPVNYGEIHIELHPPSTWKNGRSKADLVEELNHQLAKTPGINLNFTQPIQNAFDELVSGVKSQLAIKVFGDDLKTLQKLSEEIGHAVEEVPGLVDIAVEQSFGQPQLQVVADREQCARFGISVKEILAMVELAIGGGEVGNIYLNNRRFAIHMRYQERYRDSAQAIRNLLLPSAGEGLVPLGQVAQVKQVLGPMQINRENNQRRWIVQANIRGRDLGSVVAEIQRVIAEKINLPSGYVIEYGGQFENQQRAMWRLALIVPVAIAGVFIMLWISFACLRHALIIFIMVPMSIIGGVIGLLIMGQYLSVPASIGFVALFGMAMLDGLVMVSCFNDLRRNGKTLEQAVTEGSRARLAPVLATTMTTLLGLIPLLLSNGAGSEVQRPLACVVVFGLLSSTILTLLVIPVVYRMVESRYSELSVE